MGQLLPCEKGSLIYTRSSDTFTNARNPESDRKRTGILFNVQVASACKPEPGLCSPAGQLRFKPGYKVSPIPEFSLSPLDGLWAKSEETSEKQLEQF